jgi:Cytochrome c7 and related cytochrome c
METDQTKRKGRKGIRKGTQRRILCALCEILCVPLRSKLPVQCCLAGILVFVAASGAVVLTVAQTRQKKRVARPSTQQQSPQGSATKYSAFLHSSEKHKGLACNACHKVPTNWTAKREFPDVADFPNHDACVRCHRQQFFARQSLVGTGPAICSVCHLRSAPREEGRFVFGKPNAANQSIKPKDERQFVIEFPHDKHQNVIASARPDRSPDKAVNFIRASFFKPEADDEKKPDYNNCSICHQPNNSVNMVSLVRPREGDPAPNRFFKTIPHSHDTCFNCHWKNQKPTGDDCAGCHKAAATFIGVESPPRKSAMFSHEGGKGEHVMECTTCHINITRASTLRGLTPDVPITICATCHKDNKKTTYPKITTIEEEFEQLKKTGSCTYCHTAEVGKKKPPASHEAAVQ